MTKENCAIVRAAVERVLQTGAQAGTGLTVPVELAEEVDLHGTIPKAVYGLLYLFPPKGYVPPLFVGPGPVKNVGEANPVGGPPA